MAVYSFRAECPHDVDCFEQACKAAGISFTLVRYPDPPPYPDLEVEIHTEASREELIAAMQASEDGAVMDQTLRQCSRNGNSMERNYDVRRNYSTNSTGLLPPPNWRRYN